TSTPAAQNPTPSGDAARGLGGPGGAVDPLTGGGPRGGGDAGNGRGGKTGQGPRTAGPGPGGRGGPALGLRGGTPADSITKTGSAGRPAASGVAPVGAAGGAGRREEDEEHKARYGLLSSEYFEPETEDGYLVDPFRAGSFVAPETIGDEDDE